MRFIPLFLDATAGKVLLVGNGQAAIAKLRLLQAAGASVRWHVVPACPDKVDARALSEIMGGVEIFFTNPAATDLDRIIAVFCAGAGNVGHAVASRARALGIPVNVMDDLKASTCILPAIVDRGEVVVAVGTGGASPVLARRIRESIEKLLPPRIGELAGLIGRWRKQVAQHIPDLSARRLFWERFIDGPLGEQTLRGRSDDVDIALALMAERGTFASEERKGYVTLVGAGPGDPDLLTVRALRALQDADIVFYDELVSSEVLNRARRDAERIGVGHRAGACGISQDEIHRLLIEAARAGRRVVRLKAGDPLIFARGGEEIAALRAANIAYSVVPGVTAAIGAAAEAEVPLTYRREAQRIAFVTAHKADEVDRIDWSGLANPATTVAVYMGAKAAFAVRAGLLTAGRAPSTPVGVFARVSRPDAKSIVGQLKDLPSLAIEAEPGPALLIIGDVVARSHLWEHRFGGVPLHCAS